MDCHAFNDSRCEIGDLLDIETLNDAFGRLPISRLETRWVHMQEIKRF